MFLLPAESEAREKRGGASRARRGGGSLIRGLNFLLLKLILLPPLPLLNPYKVGIYTCAVYGACAMPVLAY